MPQSRILFICITLFTFLSCKKNENTISLPLSTSLNVFFADTFSIKLSTVLKDSVITSGSPTLLAGHYDDTYTGGVTATSFLEFSLLGNNFDENKFEIILTENAVYDSISLLLNTNYHYGDTLEPYKISAHELSEPIYYKYGESILYNNTHFTYEPSPLGSAILNSQRLDDTLRIPLKSSFGEKLFGLAKKGDFKISNTSNFKQLFKGLALVADAPTNKAVYGFKSTPVIRLYFHDSLSSDVPRHYDFMHLGINDLHSNKIINDRKNILGLNKLKNIYEEVEAVNMNNVAVLVTGIDLIPKIEFPYLATLKSISTNRVIVNRAQLVISPKENTFSSFYSLPPELILSLTNKTNVPIPTKLLQNSASPVISPEDDSKYTYTFDVTDFINAKLQNTQDMSLFLEPARLKSGNRTEKLILDQHNIKLIIYLTII